MGCSYLLVLLPAEIGIGEERPDEAGRREKGGEASFSPFLLL